MLIGKIDNRKELHMFLCGSTYERSTSMIIEKSVNVSMYAKNVLYFAYLPHLSLRGEDVKPNPYKVATVTKTCK